MKKLTICWTVKARQKHSNYSYCFATCKANPNGG